MNREIKGAAFLSVEAAGTGLLFSKTAGSCDDYRIYPNRSVAQSGAGATLGGSAVRLYYRQPAGQPIQGIISGESVKGQYGVYYYLADLSGNFPPNPTWSLTTGQTTDATFQFTNGVLSMTLTDQAGNSITYGATRK